MPAQPTLKSAWEAGDRLPVAMLQSTACLHSDTFAAQGFCSDSSQEGEIAGTCQQQSSSLSILS